MIIQHEQEFPNEQQPNSMPWIPAAITAAAAIGSAITGAVSGKRQQDRQNAANKKLTELTNQQQVQLVNAQNEYNTPSAQMQRYKDAGLNPYLATGSNGNQASTASLQTPSATYNNYLDKLSNVILPLANQLNQLRMSDAQINNLNATSDRLNVQTQVENEKLTDWRFRNLYGMTNAENRAKLLALQQGKLYYDLQYEYGGRKLLSQTDIDSPYGSQSFFTALPQDVLSGWRNKRDQAANSYQTYGADLRKLEYDFQKSNRDYGLGNNAPWYAQFMAQFLKHFNLHY